LEATDSTHRYGSHLSLYFKEWEKSDTDQNFFYWIDNGAGKNFEHPECSREKLEKWHIKYLGPFERQDYEIFVENGVFKYKKSGELVDTLIGSEEEGKYIFVISGEEKAYTGPKIKGTI